MVYLYERRCAYYEGRIFMYVLVFSLFVVF
ncbi:hypothetical protein SAMN05421823_10875 [Catalinimonas alkaloidigena]|uniref:Uncharacterized protein n=1 Tax=Catalinimonas alkaloidigena TaxID=1075417 RepID=A0A1G9MSL2_9BACT|nr:hypothetical protein SAMN05421823_10875 [Catalinimonas alkaloidigena]